MNRKWVLTAALSTGLVLTPIVATAATETTSATKKVVHHRPKKTHLPICREEDGSGQLACQSDRNTEGVDYVAVVVSRAGSKNGYVTRAYYYLRTGKVETIRERF